MRTSLDAAIKMPNTYHQAWNSIPPLRPKKLVAWLGKVVRNNAINLWNKNHAQKRYSGIEELLNDLDDCIPSPKTLDSEIEKRELTTFLNSWLSLLSREDRILFIRRYWMGAELRALEREYGESHGKMAKRMYRLRPELKKSLEKEGYCL